jgi:hypothetical protein
VPVTGVKVPRVPEALIRACVNAASCAEPHTKLAAPTNEKSMLSPEVQFRTRVVAEIDVSVVWQLVIDAAVLTNETVLPSEIVIADDGAAVAIEIPVAKTAALRIDVIFLNMCIPLSLRALP